MSTGMKVLFGVGCAVVGAVVALVAAYYAGKP